MTGTDTITAIDRQNTAEPWRRPNGQFGPNNPGKPKGATGRRGKAEIDRLDQRSGAIWAVIDQRLAEHCVKTALFLLARLLPSERTIDVAADAASIAEALEDSAVSTTEANRLALTVKSLKEAEQVDAMRERLDAIERLLAVQGRV